MCILFSNFNSLLKNLLNPRNLGRLLFQQYQTATFSFRLSLSIVSIEYAQQKLAQLLNFPNWVTGGEALLNKDVRLFLLTLVVLSTLVLIGALSYKPSKWGDRISSPGSKPSTIADQNSPDYRNWVRELTSSRPKSRLYPSSRAQKKEGRNHKRRKGSKRMAKSKKAPVSKKFAMK